MQERAGCAHASPVPGNVHVDVARAGHHRTVHVVQDGHTHLTGCVDEGWRCGMRIFWAADVDRAAGSAPGISAAFPVLLTLEYRTHVRKSPSRSALFRPAVVVPLHATSPYHGVDAAAATQHMAERHVE